MTSDMRQSPSTPKAHVARRALAALAATTLVGTSMVFTASAALAAPGDGTLTIRVVSDTNFNSERDATDTAISGVTVRISDASGHTVTRTTNGSGLVTLNAGDGGNTLVGGKYRVDVVNPNATNYSEATVIPGHAEPQFVPATSFVDLAGGAATALSVGYVDMRTIGAANAMIYSAVQPDSIWPSGGTSRLELYKVPYKLNAAPTAITVEPTIGTVYGIGLDQKRNEIYAGAYAKRGSAYGPGGPGAVYRVNPDTGAWELYVTVADVGTTVHNMTETNGAGHQLQDYSFRTAVGRESLGDVEVTKDGKFLLVVNMHTDSVVVYPVQTGLNPAPLQTLAIPAIDCASDWAPMAIAENDGKIYIGATCGETSRTSIIEYSISAAGQLAPTGVVWSGDPTTAPGSTNVNSGNLAHADCAKVDWRPWTDAVPQTCIDYATFNTPPNPASAGVPRQFSIPQPMLSDIEFIDTGEVVLGFRDRGGDQYGPILYYGQKTGGTGAYTDYIVTGNVHAVCLTGSTIDYDCRTALARGGDFDDYGGFHNEAAFGGIVHVPGTGRVVFNQMDPISIYTNGLRAIDPQTGNQAPASTGTANRMVTSDFRKGQGLADMEAYVRVLDQQIGNRIWIDTDEDGIQDPGEPAVAGVQVSLYDEDGVLVARTETDANGEYYFSTSDGVLPDTKYQIRLDRPADFNSGGPLAGMVPTLTAAGSDRGIDSNGANATVGEAIMVVADVTSPAESRNDHSIDFGFIPPKLVSVGDYVWFDADSDGIQDADESPIPGVLVELYNAAGVKVGETTTDPNGYYSFVNLIAGADYTIVFPTSVVFEGETVPLTDPGRGDDRGKDSNPDQGTGRVPFTAPLTGNNSGDPGQADNPTLDAGYKPAPLVSVGDYVWFDADSDGIQDADEQPIPGVLVELYNAAGVKVGETTTDPNGYYAFTDLLPGTEYTIVFPTTVVFEGKTVPLTDPGEGDDRGKDSNPDQATGSVTFTTPLTGNNSGAPGQADNPTLDAGYKPAPLVSVGDYVWFDEDGDGIQDEGEKPIPGVLVELYDAAGVKVGETTTDPNGYYAFVDLTPGADYTIVFPTTVVFEGKTVPLTDPGKGDDRGKDSNPDQATGRVPFTAPDSGNNSAEPGMADNPTLDAGYKPAPLVSVGDYVWFDADGDGIQDAGEKPIPGVLIELFDATGAKVGETTTDANGYYAFVDLIPGAAYTLVFPKTVVVDGATVPLTDPGKGGDPAADSNANPSTGWVSFIAPLTGNNSAEPGMADNPTLDVGYKPVNSALSDTGGSGQAGLLLGGLVLLVTGAGIMIARRRRA